jgi:hypothetical protein
LEDLYPLPPNHFQWSRTRRWRRQAIFPYAEVMPRRPRKESALKVTLRLVEVRLRDAHPNASPEEWRAALIAWEKQNAAHVDVTRRS